MKQFICSLTIIFLLSSCLSTPIPKREVLNKDSEPYKDFGTPLAGSYKNGEYLKSGIYIATTVITLMTSLLFAPIQESGTGIIPIDSNISTALSFSFLGIGVSTALIISPIDTAISYHVRNKKIIDLNGIKWDSNSPINKYQAIIEHRENIKKEQIENYRRKFADDTITITEIYIIGSDEDMTAALKIELEGYMKRRKNAEKSNVNAEEYQPKKEE